MSKVEENENTIFIYKKNWENIFLILCYYECINLDTMFYIYIMTFYILLNQTFKLM